MLENTIPLEEPVSLEVLRNWADSYGVTINDCIKDGDLKGYRCVFYPRPVLMGVDKNLPFNHHKLFASGTDLLTIYRFLLTQFST